MRLQQHLNESSGKTPLLEIVQLLYDKSKDYMRWMSKNRIKKYMLSGRFDNRDHFIKSIRKDRMAKDMPEDIQTMFDDKFKSKFGWKPRSEAIFVVGNYNMASYYNDNVYMIFPIGKYKFIWSDDTRDLWNTVEDGNIHYVYQDEIEIGQEDIFKFEDSIRPDIESEYMDDNPKPDEDDYLQDDGTISAGYFEDLDKWEDEKDEYITYEVYQQIDDYVHQEKQEMRNEADLEADDLVDNYTNRNLKDALDSNNEIMLGAKEYIAVKYDGYANLITRFSQYFHWRRRPTEEDMMLFAKKINLTNNELKLLQDIK